MYSYKDVNSGVNKVKEMNGKLKNVHVLTNIPVDTNLSNPFSQNLNEKFNLKENRTNLKPSLIPEKLSSDKMSVKGNVTVLSDSHGKNLYYQMSDIVENKNLVVVSKSGAKLKHIVREGQSWINNFTMKDYVVVLGGTNDFGKYDPAQFTINQALTDLLSWDYETNVIIVDIPYRFDYQEVNNNIFYANSAIKTAVQNYKGKLNLTHLEINCLMKREHYTRHGLHFSRAGKRLLAESISELIGYTKPQSPPKIATPKSLLQNPALVRSINGKIKIVTHSMEEAIKQYRSDETVGFAHSISADFHHPQHMTAGVAVVFKKLFGKPTISNCLTRHLALQKNQYEATVFNLITKGRFCSKPNTLNYNTAFEQMTKEFERRQLKHLVCSPIGCVRDNLDLNLFTSNLINFQRRTAARVTIVSYNHKSFKKVRRDMTYDEFNKRLQDLISDNMEFCDLKNFDNVDSTPTTISITTTPNSPFKLSPVDFANEDMGELTYLQQEVENVTYTTDPSKKDEVQFEPNTSAMASTESSPDADTTFSNSNVGSPWQGWPSPLSPQAANLETVGLINTVSESGDNQKQSTCVSERLLIEVTPTRSFLETYQM